MKPRFWIPLFVWCYASMLQAGARPDSLRSLRLDRGEYLDLLAKLIAESEHLQNDYPRLVPEEERVADIVVDYLAPVTAPRGPLQVRKVTYVDRRSNLIIKLPGRDSGQTVSFVGSHLDVVPADRDDWEFDPFTLGVDGDKLTGRGVTDCLGHVALVAQLFKQMAAQRIVPAVTVAAVFIANEEGGIPAGVGIDELERRGEIDFIKKGPVFWLDVADFGPTIATGAHVKWRLTFRGKLGHSAFPLNTVNPIEMVQVVLDRLQDCFYRRFTDQREKEKQFLFQTGSTFRATRIRVGGENSLNQIPGECIVEGGMRLTPFYSIAETRRWLEAEVAAIDVTKLKRYGPGRYELEDGFKASIELEWLNPDAYKGMAVDMDSPAYKALLAETERVRGKAKPFSVVGSLPLVGDLRAKGIDVQLVGFGRMAAYHADDEYGFYSEFAQGFQILAGVVAALDGP